MSEYAWLARLAAMTDVTSSSYTTGHDWGEIKVMIIVILMGLIGEGKAMRNDKGKILTQEYSKRVDPVFK